MRCGWQKFLGQEVRLAVPHGLARPVLMDACVEQTDGFRFMYVLPYGPDTVLIEDTRYSDTRLIDTAGMRTAIASYAAGQGWTIADVRAEERGALPVLLDGDIDAFWREAGDVPPTGVRAGLAHPVTGYSLPAAVAMAHALAAILPDDPAAVRRMIMAHARSAWAGQGFHRLLNRMLFLAGPPAERWLIFRRFFSLSQPLIERFFAGRTTLVDQARMLVGRPPVALLPAIRCIPRSSAAMTATAA
jgi:lycopene beta-cyclase